MDLAKAVEDMAHEVLTLSPTMTKYKSTDIHNPDGVILNRLEFVWLNPSSFYKRVIYSSIVLWIDVETELVV